MYRRVTPYAALNDPSIEVGVTLESNAAAGLAIAVRLHEAIERHAVCHARLGQPPMEGGVPLGLGCLGDGPLCLELPLPLGELPIGRVLMLQVEGDGAVH